MANMRDYKTRDRDARRRLAVHYARMKELEAGGMAHGPASQQAFEELAGGKLADRMRAWVDPFKRKIVLDRKQHAV